MKTKLINLIATLTVIVSSVVALLAPTPTYAVDICTDSGVPQSVKDAAGCGTNTKIESVVGSIIKAVIGVLGLVAVAFIVIGGVQYMTSSGDTTKLQKAKNTILYAVIGLIIAALAFAIANFAINAINTASTQP